ncbi:MAG: carbonic anhydrase [Stenomitos rutilans HA7619-LM2]|jgi:carbonic anhydrase|nr:carbonic anhydrase [Stenomitos rutilans HA7619-LM2]
MKKLVRGLREFRDTYFSTHRELFEQLSHKQKPRVLFITCSDSRIDPTLITQAAPGELFVVRNAGNIIPPFGATNGGEGAAVEYAIHALNVEQIVVCGHSHCGAMKGLLQLGKLEEEMPLVYDWLRHAEATRRLVKENYTEYEGEELVEIAIAENVLTQIENLQTYPVVHSRLYQGRLKIYGWVYHIETGEVFAYDAVDQTYVPLPQFFSEEQDGTAQAGGRFPSPVACELAMNFNIRASGNGQVDQPNPVDGTQDPGVQELAAEFWLSPEQAERIYRGSANKR